jgi:serine/threonine protein kinase
VTKTQVINSYQILSTLGRNVNGGRLTSLAERDGRKFVIKQFQFATGASWVELKGIEREISILKNLDHPGIPKYIESFETDSGFCLVQEYISAPSLSGAKPRSPEQVKVIALQVLDILVYLQSLHPPVLHRDIKPENILCNDEGQVWLVDFGLSRLGDANVAVSSMVVGTMGFIPPELFAGREPSKASDLYSLGATLLALINGVPSHRMNSLMGDDFAFSDEAFKSLESAFNGWIRQMVVVKVGDRFPDAQNARNALDGLEKVEHEGKQRSSRPLIASPSQKAKMIAANRFFAKNPFGVEENIAYDKAVREYNSIFRESSLTNLQSASATLDELNESENEKTDPLLSRLELIGKAHTRREKAEKVLDEANREYKSLYTETNRGELSAKIELGEIALGQQILALKKKMDEAEQHWEKDPENAGCKSKFMVAFHNLEAALSYAKHRKSVINASEEGDHRGAIRQQGFSLEPWHLYGLYTAFIFGIITLLSGNSHIFRPLIDSYFSSSATTSCDRAVANIKTLKSPQYKIAEDAITF